MWTLYTMATTATFMHTGLQRSTCMGTDKLHGVKVTPETWRRLNARKRPGDTFDDVVQRLLADEDADLTRP